MSLYIKYRPRDWDSVVGQDIVVKILQSSLREGKTGHAYILTGSHGIGKTTSARILAKSFNCTQLKDGNPCHECESCRAFDAGNMVDIIEIDGASNTSVNDVRDLIEKAKFEPSMGKCKVYIIDEVHMLSDGAFNALLKIIEEPPEHVKFILATTEIQKVPETIQSRARRFDFRRIQDSDVIKRLKFITEQENITTEPGSLEIIVRTARGGMRNAITLLEQYTINNNLSTSYLESVLSLLDDTFVDNIITTLYDKNITELKSILKILQEKNIQIQNFFDQIIYKLRDFMQKNLGKPEFGQYENIFEIFRKNYHSIRAISDEFLLLEITLMQAISVGNNPATSTQITYNVETSFEKNNAKITQSSNNFSSINIQTSQEKSKEIPQKSQDIQEDLHQKNKTLASEKNREKFSEINDEKNTENKPKQDFSYRVLLAELKSQPVVLAALKSASFSQKENTLTLSFQSKWHFDKINETKNQNILKEILEKLFGGQWQTQFEHKKTDTHTNVDDIF